MAHRVDRFALLRGPYRTPRFHYGRKLFCEIRGTVTVGGLREAPIPWPYAKGMGRPLILCGDLVRAVKCESSVAVAHHWGVCIGTVQVWRRVLKVPRENEGSRRLWGRIAIARTDDRLERARVNSKKPAALAKASAKLKGRVIPPHVIEAVRKAAKRPRSAAWKKKMSAYWRQRGHPPGHPDAKLWTPAEDYLLGTAPDVEIARRINRLPRAVYDRRVKLGIPAYFAQIDRRRLRQLREAAGLTRSALDAAAKLHRGAISELEGGRRRRLRRDAAERIAAHIGAWFPRAILSPKILRR
jgi:DNA-binding XRE family transcriptional regulator